MRDSRMWRDFWSAIWRADHELDQLHHRRLVIWALNGDRRCSGSGWLIDDLIEAADAEERTPKSELLGEAA